MTPAERGPSRCSLDAALAALAERVSVLAATPVEVVFAEASKDEPEDLLLRTRGLDEVVVGAAFAGYAPPGYALIGFSRAAAGRLLETLGAPQDLDDPLAQSAISEPAT